MATRKKKPAKKTPAKRGRGRPRKEIDEKLLAECAHYGASLNKAALILGVSRDLLQRNYREMFDKKSAGGDLELLKLQFQAARDLNPTMLIWLGKNRLGQTDRQDVGQVQNVDTVIQFNMGELDSKQEDSGDE